MIFIEFVLAGGEGFDRSSNIIVYFYTMSTNNAFGTLLKENMFTVRGDMAPVIWNDVYVGLARMLLYAW